MRIANVTTPSAVEIDCFQEGLVVQKYLIWDVSIVYLYQAPDDKTSVVRALW